MSCKIKEVIQHFGNASRLAKSLGVTRQAITLWKETIPEGRAYQIEVLTEGKIKAKDLLEEEKTSNDSIKRID